MKRLIFCFDGTWNKIDSEYPTNVAKLAQSIAHCDGPTAQHIYYDQGVGTHDADHFTGGVFGHGLFDNIVDAYSYLVLNHAPGDEIYVFGFSRGAFTARSFVGLIQNCGIVSRRALHMIGEAVTLYRDRKEETTPGSETMRRFRYAHRPELVLPGDVEWRRESYPNDASAVHELRIRYLGVWDTVGALGIPAELAISNLFRHRYQFHDSSLSSVVDAARHAVAADERRRTFTPALWKNLAELNAGAGPHKYLQMIFPGAHGSVGGGGPVTGLSDEALEWVLEGALAQGLKLDGDSESPIHTLRPDHRAALLNTEHSWSDDLKEFLMGIGFADRAFGSIDITAVHKSLVRRFDEPATALPEGELYRPESLRDLWEAIGAEGPRMEAFGAKSAGSVALDAPDRVDRHVVEAGDTLTELAKRLMGDADLADVLFRHNQMLGRLYDPNRLIVGQELEIPIYDKPAAVGGDHPATAANAP